MEGASIEKALGRIEAALTRIERAASTAPKADQELAARHERLREAVTLSLHQLDSLLTGQPT
ncbi:hypothetical protein [Novosphingobium sp. JCM 18896]|uniref:hypothetical protein n=1 Tax=Novosphingobium sp. JCM 18896 TaxID=2989731 RepID=UPI0022217D79|nr:hypothetical protein [Novosphingobium sp. JCM 18896]MCW1431133.1 hypothetical protein [Novosphingobium sp. JCM 18896]